MPKLCDNKSVGILVWKDKRLLMIERKIYNFGFAIPAGHPEGNLLSEVAKKELLEEVGLTADKLKEKFTIHLPNPCRREGGTYHIWTLFEAAEWSGKIKPSEDETKSHLWADKNLIAGFAVRLENFAAQNKFPLDLEHLPRLVKEINENHSWRENPGLEPPMYFLFKRLGII